MYFAACKLLERRPRNILDVGSGMGYGYKWLRQHRAVKSYTGVEPNPDCIRWCRKEYPEATWIDGVVPGISFLQPFEYVFCIEVLEHVEKEQDVCPVDFIREIAGLARRNVFLSTPNRKTSSHGRYTPDEVVDFCRRAEIDNVAYVEEQWTTWYLINGTAKSGGSDD